MAKQNTEVKTPVTPIVKPQSTALTLDTFFNHSIARQPVSIDVFKEDAQLALEFIFWLCHELSSADMFGYVKINPNKVAKDLGYKTKSHFHEVVQNPYQLEGKSLQQIEEIKNSPNTFFFKTKFENVLYKLFSIEMELHHAEIQCTKRKYTLQNVRLLDKLEIYEDLKFKNKKYYQVEVSKFFLENLTRTYLMVSSTHFVALSRSKMKGLNALYLNLSATKNYIKTKGLSGYAQNFDNLCEIVGIHNYTSQARKKQKLIQYFKEIQLTCPEFNFHYFFANNGNYNYKPVISFINNPKDTTDIAQYNKLKMFDAIVMYFWSNTFLAIDPTVIEDNDFKILFKRWMNSDQVNRPEKEKAYCEAHKLFWNRTVKPTDAQVQKFINTRNHEFDRSYFLNNN